jgi:hypothetical protein
MQRWTQLFSYLDNSYLHWMMELPTAQENKKTDLLCATQGASLQVQRRTRLFCHLHYAKSEEDNNDNDLNSSDNENPFVPLCVFVPGVELDGLTNSHDKLNTLDDTQEYLSDSHHKIAFDDDEDTVS